VMVEREMSPRNASPPGSLAQRIDAIEEAYEFMLAYAAQGRREDAEGPGTIRDFLTRADAALDGIAAAAEAWCGGAEAAAFAPFIAVLKDDAAKARAAFRLVLALRPISSQMVDNLNASIHLRALLTDLFLIDESLKGASG
jgi:hypothetical protein